MNNLIHELDALRLDLLDDDWVEAVCYSEYLDITELPVEYENALSATDVNTAFNNIIKSIEVWNEEGEDEMNWSLLFHNIKCKHLLSVLAYHIDYGTKNVMTTDYRNNAISAALVYFKLLSIPGYKAYDVYHSQLFAHCLLCLTYPKAMCDSLMFNSNPWVQDVNVLVKKLGQYAIDLRIVIEKLQLQPGDMNFDEILSSLAEIIGGAVTNKMNIDKLEFTKLMQIMHKIIDLLLRDANGEPNAAAITLMFKCLLPKFLAISTDSKAASNLVRASYVTYCGNLMNSYRKPAWRGFNILLQHICYTQYGLEKAEVRTARTALVVGLMGLLSKNKYKAFVEWLLKLSTSAKAPHRQISLEILSKILNNEPEEATEQNSSPAQEGNVPRNIRAEERSSTSVDNSIELNVSDSNTEDSEISRDLSDQGIHMEMHTVAHATLLRAVVERVHDAVSMLRTRALHVLADALQAPAPHMLRALREVDVDAEGACGQLVALAVRSVNDERAAVRRAALQLLHRFMQSSKEQTNADNLKVLVRLCRDACVSVRGSAVAALGDLCTRWPSHKVVDAFIAGPLHQLSDPDTKITEQVTSLVQQIVIDPLRQYSPGEEEDSAGAARDEGVEGLPWLFAAAITEQGKRKLLQTACFLLAKTSQCIQLRLIDKLKTHLEVPLRSLHSLVLMTSMARQVECTNVDFILNYYYQLTSKAEICDIRLLVLTFELLTEWSTWIEEDKRAELRDHLITHLKNNPWRPEGCDTVYASLAAHLYPKDLEWAFDLLHVFEQRALASDDISNWMRAVDLSLVAPTQPSAELHMLFVNALNNRTEMPVATRAALVAGLGRQCVRSRRVAAAVTPCLAQILNRREEQMAPRVNALLILADICSRYSCIAESELDSLCSCLDNDAPPQLRRAATRALTKLILGGFLRLRGSLYYRYFALLADPDSEVCEPAQYYVTSCLSPATIYSHFVDCIMHFNGYVDNPDPETAKLTFDARQLMYDVMLQRLSLVQKLNLLCTLGSQVLQHAANVCDEGGESGKELPPALGAALLDTITLLWGPRMKLPRKPGAMTEPDLDELSTRITNNIVSHQMKVTVARVLVPAVLRLYAGLRSKGGQIVTYLVKIATDLLKDYKQEIEELMKADETLMARIGEFQSTIGEVVTSGNTLNLVTASANEAETPRRGRATPRVPRTARTSRGARAPCPAATLSAGRRRLAPTPPNVHASTSFRADSPPNMHDTSIQPKVYASKSTRRRRLDTSPPNVQASTSASARADSPPNVHDTSNSSKVYASKSARRRRLDTSPPNVQASTSASARADSPPNVHDTSNSSKVYASKSARQRRLDTSPPNVRASTSASDRADSPPNVHDTSNSSKVYASKSARQRRLDTSPPNVRASTSASDRADSPPNVHDTSNSSKVYASKSARRRRLDTSPPNVRASTSASDRADSPPNVHDTSNSSKVYASKSERRRRLATSPPNVQASTPAKRLYDGVSPFRGG